MPDKPVLELIASADGDYRTWTLQGARWIVVIRHDERSPTYCFEADTEEQCKTMVDGAYALHMANNDRCMVHFYLPALPVATVTPARDYGSNGRVGRSKTLRSIRRQDEDKAQAEGRPIEGSYRAWRTARFESLMDEVGLRNEIMQAAGNLPV